MTVDGSGVAEDLATGKCAVAAVDALCDPFDFEASG